MQIGEWRPSKGLVMKKAQLFRHNKGNNTIENRTRIVTSIIVCFDFTYAVLRRCTMFLPSLPHAVNCGRFCFWRRQSVLFCLCMKYLGNRRTDLRQIHTEDVFGPSLGRVLRSRSKVKVTGTEMAFFGPLSGLRAVYV